MKQFKTLILDKNTISHLINMRQVIPPVEDAFKQYGLGKAQMPPKIYLHLEKYNGDFRAMPAYIEKINKASLKWVNVHPENKKHGLPTVMAVIILSDPQNGFPLCVMDGTFATNLRTGAAGAVAAKYLARKNSKIISMIGCGEQAKTQVLGLRQIFDIKEIKLWSKDDSCAVNFVNKMKNAKEKITIYKNIRDCVSSGDIVVTTTPSRLPIVKYSWLKKGCHVNAIGADSRGKEELEPLLLKNAKLVVDSFAQAAHSGEINVPFSKGIITKKDIYAELSDIICGKKKGRINDEEITVFDSTGLAIQDLAVANIIYNAALKKKAGKFVDLCSIGAKNKTRA